MKIHVDFFPHIGQLELNNCESRFQVICCGRRWGKTVYALNRLFKEAMEVPGLYWFCAPTYKIGIKPKWDDFTTVFKDYIRYKNEADLICKLSSGSRIDWLSLEKYDNIRGEGLTGLIMDETAQCAHAAWTDVLRPSLMDRQGWVLFISTPKGRNWFWNIFQRGISDDTKDKNWAAFTFPSWSNPHLKQEEIEEISQDLTKTLYQQEIAAQFLDDELSAIKNVDVCTIAPAGAKPHANRTYVAGVDLARKKDFTVISVFDATIGKPVEVELWRKNQGSWDVILQTVANICKKWRCKAVVDASGAGDIACSELRKRGVFLEEFIFTEQSKRNLIDNMIMKFDNFAVEILDHEIGNNEMKSFEMSISRTGKVKYEAPSGQHDDVPIARALALWQLRTGSIQVHSIMPDPIGIRQGFFGS